jgi:DNA-binding NtrC family response regulator
MGERMPEADRISRRQRCETDSIARIAFDGDAPGELLATLSSLGIANERRGSGPGLSFYFDEKVENREPLRLGDWRASAFGMAGGMNALATLILSHALDVTPPFLAASSDTVLLIRSALAAARSSASIVISGETGVGKRSLLKLILAAAGIKWPIVHIDCAARDDAEFVAVVDSALPEAVSGDLLKSGVVCLDRIGELNPTQQEIVLDRLKVRRQSDGAPVRYAALSSIGIDFLVEKGRFLPALRDLFNVQLHVSPIRERPADIALLARWFLQETIAWMGLSEDAMRVLAEYPFPGNARELQNLITRTAILADPSAGRVLGREEVIRNIAEDHTDSASPSRWRLVRERTRREMAVRALAMFDGDHQAAARSLGFDPRSILRVSAIPSRSAKGRSTSHNLCPLKPMDI